MKLHIFGASGAGVTTLGTALAKALGIPYFDSDTYFWAPSEPPFTLRRPAAERDAALAQALTTRSSWILGGSAMSWAGEWIMQSDLVVFLWLPPDLRLHRLQQRELERYGNVIFTDPIRAGQAQAFLAWAAGYDDNSSGGSRTLANHTEWLSRFSCPVLELRGDLSVAQRLAALQAQLQELALQ
jgi:adenylate kinase family enzyme